MEEYHVKSEFFSGFGYLKRIDELLKMFNEASLTNNLPAMYDIVRSYYEELTPYMNKEEEKANSNKDSEALILLQQYSEELQLNNSQNNKKYVKPWENTQFKYVKLLECKKYLRDWRIDLQKIQKKYGLLMRDSEDPNTAMMRGLSE